MPVCALAGGESLPRNTVSGRAPLDPLADAAWDELVAHHPEASLFHTAAWARVLVEAYGHRPFYFADRLGAGATLLPVLEVNSPWLGRRGVSVPFADWCPTLVGMPDAAAPLAQRALEFGRARGWRHFELRAGACEALASVPALSFRGHVIDLTGGEAHLFEAMDSSVRRGVRKATSSPLSLECSRTPEAMREFYGLYCRTRRRLGVPPQPYRFFAAIARHVLGTGQGEVISARINGQLVAGGVYFHHGTTATFKYGASDLAAQEHRPNNLVMWEAIQRYAARGCRLLHLGRTSMGNEGLRRFKLGFGAREELLEYRRFHYATNRYAAGADRAETRLNGIFRVLPLPLLRWLGARCYPHLS